MDRYYLINPNIREGAFRCAEYINYSEIPYKCYTFATLVVDNLKSETVIEDFLPICALVITEGDEIILYNGTQKIIPKNQAEILNFIQNKSDSLEQDAVIAGILDGTTMDVKTFMYAVRMSHMGR